MIALSVRKQGYLQSSLQHFLPVHPQLSLPNAQNPREQTLLSSCLKSFIKERLYGDLLQYNRANRRSSFSHYSRETDNKVKKFETKKGRNRYSGNKIIEKKVQNEYEHGGFLSSIDICPEQPPIPLEIERMRLPQIKQPAPRIAIDGKKWSQFCQNQKQRGNKNTLVKEAFRGCQCGNILASQCYDFFELGSRIRDEMRLQSYSRVMDWLVKCNARLWSVACFRFWDIDRDGVININDLFSRFQQIDAILHLSPSRDLELLMSIIDGMKKSIHKNSEANKDNSPTRTKESKYLEESMLTTPQLRCSDLSFLIGDESQQKSVVNNRKPIKFSSCYRFSITATDHDEETRVNRQKIEMLRERLRRKEDKREVKLQKGKLEGISYSQFVEGDGYLEMRKMVLDTLGVLE